MTALSTNPPRTEVQRFRRVAVARNTALGAVIATPAVLTVRGIAVSLTAVSGFQPLEIGADITLTLLGLVAAAGVALLIEHTASNPGGLFRRIVPAALGLSFLPDIALWIHGGQARAATVIPLMIMHVIVAVTAYTMLTRSLYLTR